MQVKLNNFLKELQSYQAPAGVFNPWRDYDINYDIGPDAPQIRLKQMRAFLQPRLHRARHLLVAEAVGYQGGRFTGVPLSSERILLGRHPDIAPSLILPTADGVRTSNPKQDKLQRAQREDGFTEPTATIIWKAIIDHSLDPLTILTWNIFPFHPFKEKEGPLTNRTPREGELALGAGYVQRLLELWPDLKVIAIGRKSAQTLDQGGLAHLAVPHPANGGASKFREAFGSLCRQFII